MAPEDFERLVVAMREKGCLQPILARGALPPALPKDPLKPTKAELQAEQDWLTAETPLEVIDGSHRHTAAEKAGLAYVPVTVIEATDQQAMALRVGMNKIRGELDLATVGQMLTDLTDIGALSSDIALAGFGEDEIAELIAAVRPSDDEADALAALGDTAPPDNTPDVDPDQRFTRWRSASLQRRTATAPKRR